METITESLDEAEWMSWHRINDRIKYRIWREKHPKADLSLVPIFNELMRTAEDYYWIAGKHLQLYGDVGEIYAAIVYGLKLHKDRTQGSDGKVGKDFIEVKTIGPANGNDSFSVKLSGNFNKLAVVKINQDFKIASHLVKRAKLPKRRGDLLRMKWNSFRQL